MRLSLSSVLLSFNFSELILWDLFYVSSNRNLCAKINKSFYINCLVFPEIYVCVCTEMVFVHAYMLYVLKFRSFCNFDIMFLSMGFDFS